MKPKNFPGRRNARRMQAFMRLKQCPANAEIRGLLAKRIMPEDMARSIRSKKERGAGSLFYA